ncbi:MAG: hypothetical protein L0H24_13295 [Microlunatus sp.]|nr:hypothetical protein [Microlunatus sp.]
MQENSSPIGLYWDPETWSTARAAYLSDLDRDPQCPDAYIGWLHRVIELHIARGPAGRAAAGVEPPARRQGGQGLTRTYPLVDDLVARMDDAIVDDREFGRALGRSGFVHEAVTLGIAAAMTRRDGRPLHRAPARLPTRPRRRDR